MSEGPDLSTLPERMRYAATVMREARHRLNLELYGHSPSGDNCGWQAAALEKRAAPWEAEDRADKERKDLVKDLAKRISFWIEKKPWEICELQIRYLDAAEDLVKNGWRKGDPPSAGVFDGLGKGGPW